MQRILIVILSRLLYLPCMCNKYLKMTEIHCHEHYMKIVSLKFKCIFIIFVWIYFVSKNFNSISTNFFIIMRTDFLGAMKKQSTNYWNMVDLKINQRLLKTNRIVVLFAVLFFVTRVNVF